MAGKLIVLEGTDGSGKSTQFALLCEGLRRQGRTVGTMVFPRYQEPSSALVRLYLGGAFGSRPGDVSPYAASTFFAVDRYAGYRQDWGRQYEQGVLMVSDRYTTSNAVHQAAKLPPEQRPAFLEWLADLEHDKLALPRPDLVLWLDVPTHLAVANLRRREAETGTGGDIHEVDEDYLRACREAAGQAAALYGWQRIDCADEQGGLRGVDDIHREIMARTGGI